MAFWYRVRQSKLKILSCQFRRCYIQLSNASPFNFPISHRKLQVIEMPHWFLNNRPTDVFSTSRFFAAPVQANPKKEEQNTSGPRINDEIKANFVRLVVDDVHSIVSRREALERARMLKLDLVEVQKNANPPVCKLMDFHKQKYVQQTKEKERAKSKSDVTLRKGEPKEMRFSAKTELKDLKMKADTVIKLMEKGYRVKCRAQGTEGQDMIGVLSQISSLMGDVAVVESGPHSGKKEVYMIVRHVKYGPSKKSAGGGKKLQDAKVQKAINSSDSIEEVENESFVEYGSGHDDNYEKVFGFGDNAKTDACAYNQANAAPKENSSKNNDPNCRRSAEVRDYDKGPAIPRDPPAVTENRYVRAVPKNRFQQRQRFPNAPRPGYGPETQGTKTGMNNGNREGNFHDSTLQRFSGNMRRDV